MDGYEVVLEKTPYKIGGEQVSICLKFKVYPDLTEDWSTYLWVNDLPFGDYVYRSTRSPGFLVSTTIGFLKHWADAQREADKYAKNIGSFRPVCISHVRDILEFWDLP
jgi:hypothetical protein